METKSLIRLQSYIGKSKLETPSQFGNWIAYKVLEASFGKTITEIEIRNEMLNGAGMLHGGVMAAIMDEMMGLTIACADEENYHATINLAVDFLFGAKTGEKITANTVIIRSGKHINNVQCKLTNADGVLLAKGTSNLIKTSKPRI